MKKPGMKPKGARALTKAEQQQRIRARLRIINEEMSNIGLKPLGIHMPPIYIKAMRAFEDELNSNPSIVKSVIYSSGWICRIVEDFVKRQAETIPNSEIAKIYNSPEWVSVDSINFDRAVSNANIAIYNFEQLHEAAINTNTGE